jgi:hypothetical protein
MINMQEYLNQANEQMIKFWEAHEGENVREEKLEDITRLFLSTCWDKYEENLEFEVVCETLEIHEDIVRKIYDPFMGERIVEAS